MTSVVPLPVVLCGCGAVSQQYYAPALRELAEADVVQVVALVDPAEGPRASLVRRFPATRAVAVFDDLSAAWAPPGALCVIATPPRSHCRLTVSAARRGWHVLCEKPMAATSADCTDMIAACAEAGVTLAVGHYKRFFPASATLRELCGGGSVLGELRRFTIAEGGRFRWPAVSPSFFERSETPGGVLLDIGVHVLDLLLWWLGDPIDFTYADDAMGGLEANAWVTLRFATATGSVRLSRDWATPQLYTFEFEHGAAAWKVDDANGLTLSLEGVSAQLRGTLLDAGGRPGFSRAQSFLAQLQHVVEAIREQRSVLVDGAQGARTLRLIEACYARKTLLNQPWLTPTEQQTARQRAITLS